MNSQAPIWVPLLVAAVAVLGQVILLLNGRWERDQDRTLREKELAQAVELRRLDHQHELTIKEEEDRRQLRDRRVTELRAGLTEMVEAFISLADLQHELYIYRDSRPEQIAEAEGSAKQHFNRARPRLALDAAGREVARSFREALLEVRQFRTMVDGQQTLLDAHADGAISHGEKLEAQRGKITDLLNAAVDRCQQIMDEAGEPIPTNPLRGRPAYESSSLNRSSK